MRNKPRMLTPGPTPLPERVRLAMARDMTHHRTPEFAALFREIQAGLKSLFGTAGPVLTLTASGTGAMTAAVANLFAPGETAVVVEGGRFGERWTQICKSLDVAVIPLPVEWGRALRPADLEKALAGHPEAAGVLLQVSETSTGALHPVKELAAVARQRDVLLVADGVSSVSVSPCPMDRWGIDCLLTGSQKGLMLPPGLSFIALSEKAWKKAESLPCRDFYFSLTAERDNLADAQTAFTPAVGLLYGLRESLAMFAETGLENVYRKQWALTAMARAGITALGFELLAKEHYTWGLTSLILPSGIASGPLLAHAAERYGVIMAAGMGRLKDSSIRIGHMGWVDWADIAAGLYALAASFTALGGHTGCRDYLEQALAAHEKALEGPLPF